jgi:hypothetical protein
VSKAGDVYENPVTGEREVIRVGKEESGGELVITDLYDSPAARWPARTSTRTSRRPSRWSEGAWVSGSTGARRTRSSENEAHVVVELRADAPRLERFEMMISMLYGMARDGKTDAKGRPNLLQDALFAQEFDDVIRFVKPPRFLQKVLFGALVPVAHLLRVGLRRHRLRAGPRVARGSVPGCRRLTPHRAQHVDQRRRRLSTAQARGAAPPRHRVPEPPRAGARRAEPLRSRPPHRRSRGPRRDGLGVPERPQRQRHRAVLRPVPGGVVRPAGQSHPQGRSVRSPGTSGGAVMPKPLFKGGT